ncbi:MAG: glycosyltransferase, partial [Dysgonamonadaceae bacterium]|nr:glycosyltransferase [Dysgonamonadaceae bacterium]
NEKVKIIFVPSYLTGSDGIFNLPYYDLLTGMDLTVYPSYYEPWGYTPLESIAFSIPTITTGLSGFGMWVEYEKGRQVRLSSGVEVIDRTDNNYAETVEKIAAVIAAYVEKSPNSIVCSRRAAAKLAQLAAWNHFICYYSDAYHIALTKNKLRTTNN